jgi:hypothetical protein
VPVKLTGVLGGKLAAGQPAGSGDVKDAVKDRLKGIFRR